MPFGSRWRSPARYAVAGMSYGPMASFIPEIFATRYRYSGAGLALNLAGLIGGAVPPLIAAPLMATWGAPAIGAMLGTFVANQPGEHFPTGRNQGRHNARGRCLGCGGPSMNAISSLRRTLNVWEAVGGVGGSDGTVDGDRHQPAGRGGSGRSRRSAGLPVRDRRRVADRVHDCAAIAAARRQRGGLAQRRCLTFYGVVTSTAAGIFINDLIRKLGLWPESPDWLGFVFAWVVLVVAWFRPAARLRAEPGCSG